MKKTITIIYSEKLLHRYELFDIKLKGKEKENHLLNIWQKKMSMNFVNGGNYSRKLLN